MDYSYTLYDSINDVDAEEWNRLRRGERDPFMDPRFIRAVETAMAGTGRFQHVVFRDHNGVPAASACMCSYRVDASLLTDGWTKKMAQWIGRLAPRLTHFNVVFCGLSVSAGQSHLRLAPGVDSAIVLRQLDGLLQQFAKQERAECIVIKELTAEECERLAPLESLGYRRADSLPMNHTKPDFRNFEDFCAHLKSRKRYPIRRSQKKFAKSGLHIVQCTGRDGVEKIYNDDVHKLYEAVFERAEVRLEKAPAALFQQLAVHFPDNSAFTFIYDDERVVAFAASVFTTEVFHQMFVGFDYELNPKCDLYFNLFFHAIDYAFRQNVSDIFVGQTADTFKQRKLGCYHVPLYFFVKGANVISSFIIRAGFRVLFPPRTQEIQHPKHEIRNRS